MRRRLLAAFVLVPAAAIGLANTGYFSSSAPAVASIAIGPAARACDSSCDAKWIDENLRLDQIQMVGTAESYKQRPSPAVMRLIRMGGKEHAQALDYGQPSLAAQLEGGLLKNPAAASMAMDVLPDKYVDAMKKPGFKTVHVLDVDYNSSCLTLTDCLKQVADWSNNHPRHLPIVIALSTNDARTPMPGATKPLDCDTDALDALEAEVRAAFPADHIITPDQVRGSHATLREAVTAHNWPKLGESRGKVMFVLNDTAEKVRAYQGSRKSLEGRALFVATDQASPAAAFISFPDPRKDATRIADAVKRGFLVITKADANAREARSNDTSRRDAAFASGAQIVQTNFAAADKAIGPYRVSLADNAAALCGKALAPEHCIRFEASQPARPATAAMP
jgi:hypothetical protein